MFLKLYADEALEFYQLVHIFIIAHLRCIIRFGQQIHYKYTGILFLLSIEE